MKDISIKQITTIEKIEIPSTVTKIENYAFCNCKSLTEANIPQTVKEIESSSFNGCISLSKMNIPFSVVSLVNHSFYNCKALRQIYIPSVKKIGSYAFAQCPSLHEIEIDSPEIEMGKNAYNICQNVELLKNMTFIPKGMFKNCSLIVHLILPSSLDAFVRIHSTNAIHKLKLSYQNQ